MINQFKFLFFLIAACSGYNTRCQNLIPDSSFGINGIAAFNLFSSTWDEATSMILQPDGKIILAGSDRLGPGGYTLSMKRLNTDGTPDTPFTGATYPFGTSSPTESSCMVLQNDGKILIGGYGGTGGLVRLDSSLGIDNSFGVTGLVQLNGRPVFLDYLPGGNIFCIGNHYLEKLHADGSVDSTFGLSGVKLITSMKINNAIRQTDGKYILSGDNSPAPQEYFMIARFDSSGNADTGFGNNGFTTTNISTSLGESALLSLIQPDGKIITAGTQFPSSYINFVYRFNSDGSRDTSFNYVDPDTLNSLLLNDAVLLPSGKILFCSDQTSSCAFFQLKNDGSADSTFGTNGISIPPTALLSSRIHKMLRQVDGNILVGGQLTTSPGLYQMGAIRYQSLTNVGINDLQSKTGEKIFYNSINRTVNYYFNSASSENVSSSLFDLSGRQINFLPGPSQIMTGENELAYSLPAGIATGIYIVEFKSEKLLRSGLLYIY